MELTDIMHRSQHEPLVAWLKDPLPTTALVLTAGGGQVSQKVVNAVKKVGSVMDASAPATARP